MTKTLTGLIAVATLATATAAVPTTAQERCVGCGIGAPEYPIAPPGYVYYPAYWEPLPGANCYWFPHPGLRRSRQHGRLARASRGVLLLVIRLSSVAAALMQKCQTARDHKLRPVRRYGVHL